MANKPKFEEAFKRLEEIARALEKGDVPLDESMSLYEEGMKLITLCNSRLGEAQEKIAQLSKDAEGSFQLKDFEED